ncbi:unnamed protein product [Ambrosiozyma monospora]|uniref:Unnamed protein product n=1 Tax=Ambrosiozyma monospora TaxID=43982 RepID=A0ACB5U132_AMBMO|nr:unnamed protein product [Ambrosiozyma monospora]
MYRGKFYPLYSDQNNTQDPPSSFPESSSELIIHVPDGIKIRLQAAAKATANTNFSPAPATNRSMHGTPITTNTLMNSDKVYTPLNIKINYLVKNSKNGILFHGGKHTNIPKNKWFCYTYNNDIGCSASSWVPCVDSFYEKPAWDINIIVPKTIGDIGETKIIGTKAAERALRKLQLEEMDEDDANDEPQQQGQQQQQQQFVSQKDAQQQQDEEDEDKIDESTPITVAVPDVISSKESPHTLDIDTSNGHQTRNK